METSNDTPVGRTEAERIFLAALGEKIGGMNLWLNRTSDGRPWLIVLGTMGPSHRLDFDGHQIKGGWSPESLDLNRQATEAGVCIGPPDGIVESSESPVELAKAAADWFNAREVDCRRAIDISRGLTDTLNCAVFLSSPGNIELVVAEGGATEFARSANECLGQFLTVLVESNGSIECLRPAVEELLRVLNTNAMQNREMLRSAADAVVAAFHTYAEGPSGQLS